MISENAVTVFSRFRVAILVVFAAAGAGHAQVVIDNGTVQLGINPAGDLVNNVAGQGIGLTYLPSVAAGGSGEALAPGCYCEGWGIGDLTTGEYGMSGASFGQYGITSQTVTASGTGTDSHSTGSAAVAVATVSDGALSLQVTNTFEQSISSSLYKVTIDIVNTGLTAVGNLVYRRAMDWDVPPTEFNEYVTLQGWPAANLIASSDNGFASGNPNQPLSEIEPGSSNVNFTNSGPNDHGAGFDFAFGALGVGEHLTFNIYYGAAGSVADAMLALGYVGAEVYSLGMPSTNAAVDGTPNTFIFAFSGVGGTALPCSVSGEKGCATDDVLDVTGTTVVAGDVEGAGGADTISITGDASVTGTVRGGGDGLDASAADDLGDTITLNTTGTVGAIEGNGGDDTITLTLGTVTGSVDGGDGNDTITLNGATVGAVLGGAGNDTATWTLGTLASFDGGDGSDNLTVSAATYDGTQPLSGGDDVSTADGMIDTLTLSGLTVTTAGTTLTNWENIVVSGGSLTLSDHALTVGSDPGTGLTVTGGGVLDAGPSLALTGNLTLASDGSMTTSGGGTGVYTISGTLANSGTLSLMDGAPGDRLEVAGDMSGGGRIVLDTVLGNDGSASDILVVGGSTSGTTVLSINNVGGTGAQTTNGIMVVQVAGNSAGTFLLESPLTVGNYTYALQKGSDGNWYLVSSDNTVVPPTRPTGTGVYEALPAALLAKLPTLEQRVGQRKWAGSGNSVAEQRQGAWLRFFRDKTDLNPQSSTADVEGKLTNTGMQVGYDFLTEPGDAGQWVLGATAQYNRSDNTLAAAGVAGAIDAEGYGIGATATWYGNNGVYADFQGQVNRYSVDVTGNGDKLLDGKDMTVWALGAEVGYRKALDAQSALVPQAQLTWSRLSGGSFQDDAGNAVDVGTAEQVIGRLGLAYEYNLAGTAASKTAYREKMYVIGNVLHNFSGDTTVIVNGVGLTQEDTATWAELGFGLTIEWDGNKAVYAEGNYRRSLDGGDADGVGITAGYRFSF